jgi:excisionase family DNA binding protein
MTPDYLTAREVATLLRRSLTTIYRLTQRPHDPLPARRLGGALLFVADEVTQWLNRQPKAKPALTLLPVLSILPFVQRAGLGSSRTED